MTGKYEIYQLKVNYLSLMEIDHIATIFQFYQLRAILTNTCKKFQFHIRPCHLMGTLLEHAQLTNMWPAFNKVVMTRVIWLLETRSHSLPFGLCSDIRIILVL